jgi:hypothetical protein
LRDIESIVPDHKKFVAASLSQFYPPWHELLKGAGRKFARTILSWIKNRFRPKFVGTADAKPAKRKVVVEMLRKVVPAGEANKYLTGKFPHRIEFKNHKSLYRK